MTKSRLLIIEDEAELRDDLVELLEFCGFEVASAGDGVIGLEMIRQFCPDLVICDVQLPAMTGTEILKSLLGVRGQRPIMMMFTAYGDGETLAELSRLGASACLVKPVGFDQMLAQIQGLLASRAAATSTPPDSGAMILVVEQEAALAEEIVELLERHGIHARCADSIATALDVIRTTPQIATALVDIGLGQENGLNLIRAVAQDPILVARELRFALISGTSPDRERIAQLPIPPVACLQKPVRPADLLAFLADPVS